MEAFGGIILLLSLLMGVIGIIGLLKGKVKRFKLYGRKKSAYVVLASFILFVTAGTIIGTTSPAPIDEPSNSEIVQTTESNSKQTELIKSADVTSSENQENKQTVSKPSDQVQTNTNSTSKEVLNGQLVVHFIDVGQGASQLIIGPKGKTILIDGGNNDDERRVVEYLKDQHVKRVDILVGTHPDADHIGGIDAVIDAFDIGKIYMPKVQANTKTFESVLQSIKNKGLKVTTAKAGLNLDWEENVEVKMIAPVKETYEDRNDMSAVIKLAYGKNSFLFTGDAETNSENDMINTGVNLQSDVVLVAHHGSRSSTSQMFLNHVKPTYAVIQVGENSYGHPTNEILSRLNKNGIKIYRTDKDGNIVFTSNGQTVSVNKNPWKYTINGSPTGTKTGGTGSGGIVTAVTTTSKQATGSSNQVTKIVVKASVDDETPYQNSTVTVTVLVKDNNEKPLNGAKVTLTLHYKSKDTTYNGITDSNGVATIPFKIGRASKGFTVVGDVVVTYNGKTSTTKIQFTPQ